tara:strand:- start:726 stop:2054 length:1329 start_codon:yes stop_codon:yes gene_type:complete
MKNISEDDWIELYITIQEIISELLQDNLFNILNSTMQNELCEEIYNILSSSLNNYFESNDEEYEEVYDLVEQIVEIEFERIDIPKRSLTMTIETMNDLSYEEKAIIENQINKLRNIPQPKQKTNEWYEFRHNLISASSLWKIFGSQSQQNSLIYEKCKPIDISKCEMFSSFSGGTLHWGIKYEPVTTMIYEDMYQTKVEEFGCIQHPKYSFIGASPDGIIIDKNSQKYGRMLEIKNIVNREITGIPKNEYWVQTQIQMETCDLELCDFVETRIKEYNSEQEFYNDSQSRDYKGVILHFIEKPTISNNIEDLSHFKPNVPIYVYKPIEIENTKSAIDKWINETKNIKSDEGLALFTPIYWFLDEYSCVTIPRNKIWFENAISKIEECWNIILEERKSGYEHRAAKKRKPTNIILDNSSNIYKTNIKKQDNVCLIRLDENGNII